MDQVPHKKSTLTVEQLAERTPLSAGITANNPIFKLNKEDGFHADIIDDKDMSVFIEQDSELRLMACKQQPFVSIYKFGDNYVSIPNLYMDHVEGGLGDTYEEEYEVPQDEHATIA